MRLIDADELPVKTDWSKQYVLYTAIDDAPTIDAVPVVRCRDCKHITPVEGGLPLCTLHNIARAYNDFCSDGARVDGE